MHEPLGQVALAARSKGAGAVLAVPTDMASADSVKALIERTIREFGRLDVLLLNHAAFDEGMVVEHSNSSRMENIFMVLWRVSFS